MSQSEEPPYKYVSIEGPVMSIDESSDNDLLAMAIRYLGKDSGEQYAKNSESGGGVIVRVKPERWLSVDYGKS
jgi:hypothetical protein